MSLTLARTGSSMRSHDRSVETPARGPRQDGDNGRDGRAGNQPAALVGTVETPARRQGAHKPLGRPWTGKAPLPAIAHRDRPGSLLEAPLTKQPTRMTFKAKPATQAIARTAVTASHIASNEVEQALRSSQFAFHRKLYDLRGEFIVKEARLRDDYLAEVSAITAQAEAD